MPMRFPPISRSLAAGVVLASGLATGQAHAAGYSISGGASVTASRDFTPAVSFDINGASRQWGPVTWQPVASIGWVGARDVRPSLDEDVAVLGAGVRLVDWWKQAFFSFQLGYASERTDALSSHGQFISSLGWEGESFVWTIRHISNANFFGGKNLGETMLLAGVRF